MSNMSPIARKQRQLYGDPFMLARTVAVRQHLGLRPAGLGRFGAAGASVYSGPPIGAGARGGATIGAMQGASLGTAIVPVIGTAIGAIIGAIGGAIAGSINKRDPEEADFNQAVARWQQDRLSVLNLANKYLPIAGLFDLNLKGPHIPIYQKYGRMGEFRFVNDMMNRVNAAAAQGTITAQDTPQTVMVKVVQPWIDSWGFGPMADPHSDLINLLMMGLIADYVAGMQGNWKATGGDWPFGALAPFSLPTAAGPASASTAAQYAPTSSIAPATLAAITAPTPPQLVSAPVQQVVQPGTILTMDNSTATATSNTALRNAQGQLFWLGAPLNAGGNAIYMNGTITNQGGGSAVGLGLLNGGQVYAKNAQGAWYQWDGGNFVPIAGTPTQNAPAQPAPAGGGSQNAPAQPVPAGYSLVGTANGLSAYQGLDGNFYSWNGVTMAPLTGVLTTPSGMSANILNGVAQPNAAAATGLPSLTSAGQQPYNSLAPSVGGTPAGGSYQNYPQPQAPVAAQGTPPIPTPVTAGVSTAGLPSWVTWGAILAGGYFMFATARPVGKIRMPKRRRS